MQKQQTKIVECFSKVLEIKQQSQTSIIYQSIHPKHFNESNISHSRQLNLQNINYHLQNPFNIQNLSITPSLLQNQIHYHKMKSLIIIDSSPMSNNVDKSKDIPDILKNYSIVKGYQYSYKLGLKKQQSIELLYDLDHILKTISYQFDLGNGFYKPTFIGQLDINQLINDLKISQQHQKKYIWSILKAYFIYSSKTKCPIIFNCLGSKANAFTKYTKLFKSNYHSKTKQQFQQIYSFLTKLLEFAQKQTLTNNIFSNLLIFNPPINISIQVIPSTEHPNSFLKAQNSFHQYLNQLRQNYKCYIGFSILRYNDQNCIIYIGKQMKDYENRTIITGDVEFKTDLLNYGGKGMFYKRDQQIIESVYELNLSEIINKNWLDLIGWRIKQKIVVQIKYWACDGCKKDNEQSIEAFKKFGKMFCSMNCLRGYKF